MPLFEVINVDNEKLKEISKKYFNVELGKCLKSSQNHTFLTSKKKESSGEEIEQFILRVTPDLKKERVESTKLEVELLSYLYDNGLTVCPAIPNQIDGNKYLVIDDMIICLFKFAIGESINYMEFSNWMKDEKIIGLGKWFGKLHKLIPNFVKDNKDLVKSGARHWQELHSGVLKGVEVDPRDLETSKDINKFTIIHGDVNPSNYHWISDLNLPCMFDWDQLQESWLLYDLSAPIWGVVSLETFGIAGNKVPEANTKQFTDNLLKGYESEMGESTDRDALNRMVAIRRQLYIRFCKAAVLELESTGKTDGEMYKFCKKMTENFENEEKQQQQQQQQKQ